MKKLAALIFGLIVTGLSFAQQSSQVYLKTFGDKSDPAVIFLHGGPGYNSVSFEYTTAQKLADSGHFVVVWDHAGSGRSKAVETAFTFEAFNQSLRVIYDQLDLNKATLMGHSFGGTLAIQFANAFPEKVKRLVLVSSPLSYPEVYQTILKNCRRIYEAKKDQQALQYISMLEKMDPSSLEYSAYTFAHAMKCGLYQPAKLTKEARELYQRLMSSKDAALLNEMERMPVAGYYKQEQYTSLNLAEALKKLKALKLPVIALYGEEDGLFDADHIGKMAKLIGEAKTVTLEGASHNVFIDRQPEFLTHVLKK